MKPPRITTKCDLDEAQRFPMPFGKHKAHTLGWIAHHDLLYLDWLAGLDDLPSPLRAYVARLCEYHADDIDAAIEERNQA